ncbi:hypothetical protein ABW19_dt0206316 [Dactylella cylindrospora]|nr:hypothetical protein ABW19_dt0206316 [Dactylella cylindrospora]
MTIEVQPTPAAVLSVATATQTKYHKNNAEIIITAVEARDDSKIASFANVKSVPRGEAKPKIFDIDNDDWCNFKAKRALKVVVVGGGVAGLAAALGLRLAGHSVTILESVSEIKEVGAGIQVAPNAARILARFGVLEELKKDAIMIKSNSIRRWKDDSEIGSVPLMPFVEKKYKAPLMVVHRADLQKVLYDAAIRHGVVIRTGCSVVKCDDEFDPKVQLRSGEWVGGDVVIAADGVKSLVRAEIARRKGYEDVTMSTGDAAYRIVISEERMEGDEKALALLRGSIGSRWMGPGGHIMAYPVRSHKLYNMVLIHPIRPTQLNNESWTSRGTKAEMLKTYAGWNPTVRHLMSYVPEGEVMEWTLNSHSPLPSWVENRFVLIGDSCHPMLPYVAQGAANAIEDAAVLAVALSLISSADGISNALRLYETVRKQRGEAIQASARTTQKVLHLPDGEEQEDRDRKITESTKSATRALGEGAGGRGVGNAGEKRNPDLWADQQWQDFMWGVDVMKETLVRGEDLVEESGLYESKM